MNHDRTVIGYHGCDADVAAHVLEGGTFLPSTNAYDWLGSGVYFWEYGPERALQFAEEQIRRGRVRRPAVIGAVIQLGHCFDLFDTRYTYELREAHPIIRRAYKSDGRTLPSNQGPTQDRLRRFLDCTVINAYLALCAERGVTYDTVRGGFAEGRPAFAGSKIREKTHIQIAVRSPACVLGVFRPTMRTR